MADQRIVDLPTKVASGIAATDKLLGIDSAEGYQMLIQDLGDYIIQHATSSLAGSSQTLANAISSLNSNMDNAVYHIIPRCKDITSYFTDGTLWNRISGTGYAHAYYDIMPGDYIDLGRTVSAPNVNSGSSGATGSRYATVISCGGLYGNGDSSAVTYPHLVMAPGQGLGGTQHFGTHQMNATNTTTGGYIGSVMHTAVLGDVVSAGSIASGATINQQLYYIFGSHLKTVRELMSNAVADGKSSGWAWASVQAVLMTEAEVYGTNAWSAHRGNDTGTGHHQFELFALNRQAINNRSAWYWLRDVASASWFCRSNNDGAANCNYASYAGGCVRPRFVLA